eukprot:TRINITY_DN3716_c0_g1_i1.p1 TRINITY_DN3716_c0_g1~~TRINITY_DN3716_c0_g1_i1.p1  ORF type:complete len:301 (+),score=109.62 TRINITY_DN3716_c0_g1_i1:142-1044(+)
MISSVKEILDKTAKAAPQAFHSLRILISMDKLSTYPFIPAAKNALSLVQEHPGKAASACALITGTMAAIGLMKRRFNRRSQFIEALPPDEEISELFAQLNETDSTIEDSLQKEEEIEELRALVKELEDANAEYERELEDRQRQFEEQLSSAHRELHEMLANVDLLSDTKESLQQERERLVTEVRQREEKFRRTMEKMQKERESKAEEEKILMMSKTEAASESSSIATSRQKRTHTFDHIRRENVSLRRETKDLKEKCEKLERLVHSLKLDVEKYKENSSLPSAAARKSKAGFKGPGIRVR